MCNELPGALIGKRQRVTIDWNGNRVDRVRYGVLSSDKSQYLPLCFLFGSWLRGSSKKELICIAASRADAGKPRSCVLIQHPSA